MSFRECYVYIQLPQSNETVTAGLLSWQPNVSGQPIGRFVYGKSYLTRKNRLALDEFVLPLEEREFECITNEGIFGPIRDASPDSWGRHVIQKNTDRTQWDEIGYLLNSAEDRVGALSFGIGQLPPPPVRKYNKTVALDALISAAQKLEKDEPVDETEKTLLMAGASMGGARPKTTVEDRNSLWLAKFPSHDDRHNFSKIEFATMSLAQECGLRAPEIRLKKVGKQDVFFIRRFDREWDSKHRLYKKKHFISGLTALDIDERDRDRFSYLDLADQLRRRIKSPQGSLRELFSRMVFNSLVSNTDDHPRNHGLIYNGRTYEISPLYDVVPKPEVGTERFSAMVVGTDDRAFARNNVLSRFDVFGISKDDAENIYSSMRAQVANWRKHFSRIKVSKQDIEYIAPAFNWEEL